MDSAVLINIDLKCLEKWLESNKISINVDFQFSYNKNVHFLPPTLKILVGRVDSISEPFSELQNVQFAFVMLTHHLGQLDSNINPPTFMHEFN